MLISTVFYNKIDNIYKHIIKNKDKLSTFQVDFLFQFPMRFLNQKIFDAIRSDNFGILMMAQDLA